MLNIILQNLFKVFSWWVVVAPWEQALRVRGGKHVTRLEAGIYFKIPFLDKVFKRSTRKRISLIRPQTLTTKDNHTITLCGALGYQIDDLEKLFNSLNSPEDSLEAEVSARTSDFIIKRTLEECGPKEIEEYVRTHMDLGQYGLGSQEFYLTSFARVKTYRLITGDIPFWEKNGSSLNTNSEETNTPI